MAFFRPHVYAPYAQQASQPAPSFDGLFRLLDDWDKHHQKAQQHRRTSSRTPAFTPKFDVKETETTYELYGELPGVDKKDISMEFSDPQTLVIRGRVERRTTTTTDNLALTESEAGEEPVLIDHAADEDQHETSSQRSFKATVEDDTEDESAASVAAATPATTVAETAKPAVESPVAAPAPAAPKHKYWISERNVGEFARSFTFPSRIEIESVGASLERGILAVTVPKAKRYEARRIHLL